MNQETSQKQSITRLRTPKETIAQFVRNKLGGYPAQQRLFCFEDTGIYSLPLAYYLSYNKFTYWQVAPIEIKRSKGITRGKSDKSDSRDIALYACTHSTFRIF